METKDQFQKIIEWLKQIRRTTASKKDINDIQDKLNDRIQLLEKKLNLRIDGLDERFDALFHKGIQKIKHEIRELMH